MRCLPDVDRRGEAPILTWMSSVGVEVDPGGAATAADAVRAIPFEGP